MAKPKTKTDKPSKEPAAEPKGAAPEAPQEQPAAPTPTVLTAEEKALLDQAHTLLVNIPRFSVKAARLGYSDEEHKLGWQLHAVASGQERHFGHWIAENDASEAAIGGTGEQSRLLREIDKFENTWFPQVRMMIARYIPEDNVERFTAGFFKNLKQQPLSDKVLESVGTLLKRVAELEESEESGAKKLYKEIVKRGLTPKAAEEMREKIAQAKRQAPPKTAAPVVTAADLAKAKENQLAAVKKLRLWYNDWATRFRGPEGFTVREQITLGLTSPKRRSTGGDDGAAVDEEPDAPEGDEGEGEG